MERYAVFVDAGYLVSGGGWATVGTYRRGSLHVDVAPLILWLQELTKAEADGRELLRLYWYDGAPEREPTEEQRQVAALPDTKIRLGTLNRFGVQKGVDALLIVDMLDLAASHAVDVCFLVSGDEDLVEAVNRAQRSGVRLHLLGVDTPKNTVSRELRNSADRVRFLSGRELTPFFSLVPARESAAVTATHPLQVSTFPFDVARAPASAHAVTVNGAPLPTYADVDLDEARDAGRRWAAAWYKRCSPDDLALVREATRPYVPVAIDRILIPTVRTDLGLGPDDLFDVDAKAAIRAGFWDQWELLESRP